MGGSREGLRHDGDDRGVELLEAGTPPVAQAVGLGAAIDYLQGLGMDRGCSHWRATANAYDIGYTYDGVGNRVTKTNGGVATTYSYDAGDKMLRLEDNTGITTLTYDLNGNQTVKVAPNMAVTTYSYGYENKMTGVVFPDNSLNTFVYDGEGKRLEKRDSAGTLRFVYDEQGPTGLYDLVAERDGAGSLQAFYTQGPSLLAARRGANSYFYHGDALRSTSEVTDSTQTAVQTYRYYAFGEILSQSGQLTNPFKYVGGLGYYADPDTDLLLLRARYYWPKVGRFLAVDPQREGVNWRIYAGNRPTAGTDPSGAWKLNCVHMDKNLCDKEPNYPDTYSDQTIRGCHCCAPCMHDRMDRKDEWEHEDYLEDQLPWALQTAGSLHAIALRLAMKCVWRIESWADKRAHGPTEDYGLFQFTDACWENPVLKFSDEWWIPETETRCKRWTNIRGAIAVVWYLAGCRNSQDDPQHKNKDIFVSLGKWPGTIGRQEYAKCLKEQWDGVPDLAGRIPFPRPGHKVTPAEVKAVLSALEVPKCAQGADMLYGPQILP